MILLNQTILLGGDLLPPRTKSRVGWKIILVILAGIALHLLSTRLPHPIQKHYGDVFHAAIVVLVGGAVAYLVEHWLNRVATERLGPRRATSFRFLSRLLLYLALALALLAAFGVGLSSVVFGSAFITVILGLAGQNFFGNLIAGIGLVLFHPFDVGDHISFVTWQYGLLMPSFPHEQMKPTYSGVVTDINLAYTTLQTADGTPMMVPNGAMIQASIENRKRAEHVPFRFRFDLDLVLDPSRLISALETRFQSLPAHIQVQLADVGATTFSVVLTGRTREPNIDAFKHQVLAILIPLVQELKMSEPDASAESH